MYCVGTSLCALLKIPKHSTLKWVDFSSGYEGRPVLRALERYIDKSNDRSSIKTNDDISTNFSRFFITVTKNSTWISCFLANCDKNVILTLKLDYPSHVAFVAHFSHVSLVKKHCNSTFQSNFSVKKIFNYQLLNKINAVNKMEAL